ncbi:MAG TPA: PspC domain-containing protein [Planctomycetota bacterium]|jgi:phage shock protein C|nr:PspC domain-containing protein [Planctomycetota bacterium]
MAEHRRLYRAEKDRMIGGVCAGIGEALNVDPTLVRVAWVGIAILTVILPMTLFYLACWFIIPPESRVK